MRGIVGKRIVLKHHPFPFRDKVKKEYIIGEALLRWKGMQKEHIATLRNVDFDPPDLIFGTKESGKIRMEITESVPYDRNSEAKSANFLKGLKGYLRDLGTKPSKPSNILISREQYAFPLVRPIEIKRIAAQIDGFFKAKDFEDKYEIIQEVVASPIRVTFIPALGVWASPTGNYTDNLGVQDITGYPLAKKEYERSYETIIKSKSHTETTSDILIIFQGTIGIVGLGETLLDQVKNRLASDLNHKGIYIVEIITFPSDYWVHVITVREHPLF